MKLGDGKWPIKQTGEGTVKTRKAGVTKGPEWVQGERRNGGMNKGTGKRATMIYVLLFLRTVTCCQMPFHLCL